VSCSLVMLSRSLGSISIKYLYGSIPNMLHDPIRVRYMAVSHAESSLSTKSQFLRPSVSGRMLRSTTLLSMSLYPCWQ